MTPLWLLLLLAANTPGNFIFVGILLICAAKYGWTKTGRSSFLASRGIDTPEAKRKLNHDLGWATLYVSVPVLVALLLFMALSPWSIRARVDVCTLPPLFIILPVMLVRGYISIKELQAAKHLP